MLEQPRTILKPVSENEFHLAAYQGDLEKVKNLIDDGHNVSQENFRNQNALHFAAINGNLELVKLLVDAGLQPAQKVKNKNGCHLLVLLEIICLFF